MPNPLITPASKPTSNTMLHTALPRIHRRQALQTVLGAATAWAAPMAWAQSARTGTGPGQSDGRLVVVLEAGLEAGVIWGVWHGWLHGVWL